MYQRENASIKDNQTKTQAFIHGMSIEQIQSLYLKYSGKDMVLARRKKFGFEPDLEYLGQLVLQYSLEEVLLQQEK